MFGKLLAISAVFWFACTAGPTSPDEYRTPSMAIHVRFADLPTGGVGYATLQVDRLTKADDSPTGTTIGGSVSKKGGGWGATPVPAGADDVRFDVVAGYAAADEYLPSLRFFRLSASLWSADWGPGQQYDGYWTQPGLLLVYAVRATPWTLFAPGSPTVTFPAGYSWLRRACGAVPGEIQMEVLPIEQVVELGHVGGDPDAIDVLSTQLPEPQVSEQQFAESCGAPKTTADVGTRASFDRAGKLVWSPDNATLYYLSLADSENPAAPVGLRQLRLADKATTELATVSAGSGLQIDTAENLYVSSPAELSRVSLAAGLPATLVPIAPAGTLSPNGRWLSYRSNDGSTHIWDVQAGSDLTAVSGGNPTWSPDNEMAYWSYSHFDSPPPTSTLNTVAPGASPRTYLFAYPGSPPTIAVAWTPGGAVVARTPFDFPPSDTGATCGGCFGLSLSDPETGAERPVLDGSVGLVRQATSVRDYLFVWATNCLGLYETLCSSSLFRVHLTTAIAETVATASKTLPLAVSSDGRHLALSTSDGIYVRDLP